MSALRLSDAASANVAETGIDPLDDVAALRAGLHTRAPVCTRARRCSRGVSTDPTTTARRDGTPWHTSS